MQLGSVFIWNSFPFRREGKEKNRYFVYFGESHYPDNPVKVFLITTTSRIYHYEEEGARKDHNYYRFIAGSFGFVEDSILDVDSPYNIEKKDFEDYKEDLEEKEKLPETILKYSGNRERFSVPIYPFLSDISRSDPLMFDL